MVDLKMILYEFFLLIFGIFSDFFITIIYKIIDFFKFLLRKNWNLFYVIRIIDLFSIFCLYFIN